MQEPVRDFEKIDAVGLCPAEVADGDGSVRAIRPLRRLPHRRGGLQHRGAHDVGRHEHPVVRLASEVGERLGADGDGVGGLHRPPIAVEALLVQLDVLGGHVLQRRDVGHDVGVEDEIVGVEDGDAAELPHPCEQQLDVAVPGHAVKDDEAVVRSNRRKLELAVALDVDGGAEQLELLGLMVAAVPLETSGAPETKSAALRRSVGARGMPGCRSASSASGKRSLRRRRIGFGTTLFPSSASRRRRCALARAHARHLPRAHRPSARSGAVDLDDSLPVISASRRWKLFDLGEAVASGARARGLAGAQLPAESRRLRASLASRAWWFASRAAACVS